MSQDPDSMQSPEQVSDIKNKASLFAGALRARQFCEALACGASGDRKQRSGDRPVVVWVEFGRTFIKYMGGLRMETMRVATQACNYTAQLFRSKSMRKSLKKVQILLAGTCNLELDQYNILNEIELSKVFSRSRVASY